MKIEKAHWITEGDNVRLTMPLQKIDTEKRIVSGFATLDNTDLHGDVVTKEASQRAFARFRGNVRLMHQPVPAGKLVNFREEEYFDPKTNKTYNGIYVDAYISKGAENIWEMVKDGTLTGFSIGGSVKEAANEFVKDAGRTVRFVKDYEMVELSLVDNPANQLSNIFSIQKTADGDRADGMLANVSLENVFYCKKGHEPVALIGAEDEKSCVDCGSPMQNIGWFESDGGDKAEKVQSIVKKFEAGSTEGGENMAKEEKVTEVPSDGKVEEVKQETVVETAEEVSPKGKEEVAPEGEEAKTATTVEESQVTVTGTGEEKVEEAKKLNEDAPKDGDVQENPLTKMFDDLHAKIDDVFEKTAEKQAAALSEVTADFEKKLGELSGKHAELAERFGTLTEKLDNFEKKFEGIASSGALKKSADLGGSEEDSSLKKSRESKWGGVFSIDGLMH
jgi:hypothetical protein